MAISPFVGVNHADSNAARIANAWRQGTQRSIRDDLGMKYDGYYSKGEKVADFISGTMLDAASSTTNAVLLGGGSLAVAGGNAANNELMETEGSDLTGKQRYLSALAHGIAEGAFEKLSLGNFKALSETPVTSARQLVKNYLKSSFVEGSEEFMTDVANDVTDILIKREKSDAWEDYNQRKEAGFSEHDAVVGAIEDRLKSAGMSFLGGAISGGVTTGIAGAMGTYGTGAEFFRDYQKDGKTDYQAIIDSVDDSTESGKRVKEMAGKLQTMQENGQRINNLQNGYLQNAMEEHAYEIDRKERKEAARTLKDADSVLEALAETKNTEGEDIEIKAPYNVLSDQGIGSRRNAAIRKELKEDTLKKAESRAMEEFAKPYGEHGQQAFRENYDGNLPMPVYMQAYNTAYNLGRYGAKIEDAKTAQTALLGTEQFQNIFKAGVDDRALNKQEIQALNQNYKERQELRTGGVMEAVPETSPALKTVLEGLGKRTGLLFRVTDSSRYDSNIGDNSALGGYQKGRGVVTIDLSSPNPLATVSHEMTHWMQDYNPEAYQFFKEEAIQAIARSKDIELDRLADVYRDTYEKHGQNLSVDEVMDEIVADSTGDFLNDAEFAEKVIRNDRSMGQKILDWITSVRDALKELISRRGLRQANEALREDLSRYESARETWLSVLDMTSDLMKRSERTYENEQGNVNEDFVKFQRIIEDQKRKSIEERIDEALTGGGVGAHVYLGETPKFLIDEFNLQALPMMITNKHVKTTILNGKDTKHDHYHDLGKQKFIEAIQSIDAPVMVIKAENTLDLLIVTDKKDQKGNLIFAVIHPNGKGMINGVEIRSNITKSLYAKKTTNYIQKAVNDGRVLYINKKSQKTNLPRIQFPSDFESTSVKKSIAQYVRDVNMGNQGNQTQNNNSSDKNQFDIPEVKNKLDVSTAVEESKRFIAVHNLSERNLLRTLKLEGIPMPSIAVTNPKLGWNFTENPQLL